VSAIHRASLRCHGSSPYIRSWICFQRCWDDPMGATADPDQAGTATNRNWPSRLTRSRIGFFCFCASAQAFAASEGGVHRLIIGRDDNLARSEPSFRRRAVRLDTLDQHARRARLQAQLAAVRIGADGSAAMTRAPVSTPARSVDPKIRNGMRCPPDVSPGSRGPHSAAVLLSSPAPRWAFRSSSTALRWSSVAPAAFVAPSALG
jgi:hypothetical protein